MTQTETESEAHALLKDLRRLYPDTPFLALGQTVFWDEPVKAVLRQLLDDSNTGGEMVVDVHDTDYFAKTKVRHAGAGKFALLPHNDGSTRDLWSAAGEVSTLFGSETFPRRHDFMRSGVQFDRLARSDAEGRQQFQDAATEAWGWRGLVYTGSRDLIVSRLPLRDVGDGILQMLAWGFDNAVKQIGPNCCCNEAHGIAEAVTGWCRDYCQAYPDQFLTDLFQHVLPRIYCLLLGRAPGNLTVDGTANLLRFAPDTASLPRFRFVDHFIQPTSRELAIDAYNKAVAGSMIYTLDKFGAGALPFDIVAPGRGRGTLRITPRVVFVETPQPIAIGLKRPVESINELAEVLSRRLGDRITLVGKAVTLVSMLAQEFIFVFNEEGSMYVNRTRQLNDTLVANGIELDVKPILRMRYHTWDALSVGKSTIRLPEHLASTFGRTTITSPEFAAEWRSVVAEQRALCATSASLCKPRELLAYLHGRYPSDSWADRLKRYNAAKSKSQELYSAALAVHERVRSSYAELANLRDRRRTTQQQMGAHYRSTLTWTDAEHDRRSEFRFELAETDTAIRVERRRLVALKARARTIEQCEDAKAARAELDVIEREAEVARLDLVRNALLTVAGLTHTNHRPSAWWLPMMDSTGEWFRKIVSTTQFYIEPLLTLSMIERSEPPPDLGRLRALGLAIAMLMAVIVVRLWFLQIVNGPEFADNANTQRTRSIHRAAARGSILDSQGRPLATTRPQFVISLIPDVARKSPVIYSRLAALLHTSEAELRSQIQATTVHDRLSPSDPVPVVKNASIDLLSQVEEQRVDLPGILITRDPVRYYVDSETCTHLLGMARPINHDELENAIKRGLDYRGGDVIGREGLEQTYESDLRGHDGVQRISVNAHGRIEHVLDETPPVPGHTLRLTIDGDLQRTAYQALQEPLQSGHAGAAVAIDPNDGSVLALVSTPSYDANTYTKTIKQLIANPLRPMVNRATDSGYPIGSTFKLVTSAAGLESGVINPNSRMYCPGYLRVGDRTFHCDKASGHGSLDLYNAIAQSCDVYFYHVGLEVGIDRLTSWAHNFGLGEKTGIDLPETVDKAGLIPSPAWKKKTKRGPWVTGDLVNMSIGQGAILVTPLQLACYTAALANGGDLLTPQLVREIDDTSSGKPDAIKTLVRHSRRSLGISMEHRNAIVEGMKRAMEPGGTAQVLAIPGMEVAGKTGSAQMMFNGHHRLNSVFVCFAPADHPKIAIAVLVEGAGFGMEVAGPIARRMLSQYFHLNLAPVDMHVGRIHGGD